MNILLYNTKTKKKEEFSPISAGKARIYHCGPTVYDYAHIGNLRAYVFADTLRRALEANNYEVLQVINITDIGHLSGDGDDGDDKMTNALKREGKPMTLEAMRELANFYFEKFKEDLKYLNIKTPHHFPFASDHIKEEIEVIKKLEEKGFTYKITDGIYFDTSKDVNYGKLGQVSSDDEHSRIGVSGEKKSGRDFALWKFGSQNEIGYDSPWGKGFPGWHIECSAMSMKYLGETFDIHTGGVDHIPIHHNNEIAQSENATGKDFAKIWMHGAFLNVSDEKMSKSKGTVTKLIDLIGEGYSPIAYRLLLLQGHYRTPMNFTRDALSGTQEALYGIYKSLFELEDGGKVNEEFKNKFIDAINDDLNTPKAVSILFELLKSEMSGADKKATALYFDQVLGLEIKEAVELMKQDLNNIPLEIRKMLSDREEARKYKKFDEADKLRTQIEKAGYIIEDSENGAKLSRK